MLSDTHFRKLKVILLGKKDMLLVLLLVSLVRGMEGRIETWRKVCERTVDRPLVLVVVVVLNWSFKEIEVTVVVRNSYVASQGNDKETWNPLDFQSMQLNLYAAAAAISWCKTTTSSLNRLATYFQVSPFIKINALYSLSLTPEPLSSLITNFNWQTQPNYT